MILPNFCSNSFKPNFASEFQRSPNNYFFSFVQCRIHPFPNAFKTNHCSYQSQKRPCLNVRSSLENEKNNLSSASDNAPKSNSFSDSDLLRNVNESSQWGSRTIVPRRFLIGNLLAASIVLVSNFLGSTSYLLGLIPDVSRALQLDLLYPVQGFKRCVDFNKGFEFLYPSNWVGDQRLLYRAAERAENERNFDSFSLKTTRRQNFDPSVAFGPPGSDGELNVSVVISPISSNFNLERLGSPNQVGEQFLSSIIAPSNSDKVAVLFDASSRKDENGVTYYTLDYSVKSPVFYRHNLSVYAVYNGFLYTLNAQSPDPIWEDVKVDLAAVVDSFRVSKVVKP